MSKWKRLPVFLPMKGCPGRCVYCDQGAITGETPPTPEEIIRDGLQISGPLELCYFGGSFTCLPIDIQEKYLAVSDVLKCPVRMSTHPLGIDKATLDRLSKHRISMIELGISSMDDNVLKSCRRGYVSSLALEKLGLLLKEGYSTCAQMMIGLPGQTEKSSMEDLKQLADLKGNGDMTLRIYPCLVLRNTELARMMKNGYEPLSIEEAVSWGANMYNEAKRLGFWIQRVGLSETPTLAEAVLGGPHHAALGELIKSRALANKFFQMSSKGPWVIHDRNISLMTGHSSSGITHLESLSGLSASYIRKSIIKFPK